MCNGTVTSSSRHRPAFRQRLRLFQHRLCGLLLHVRRVAMLAQNTAHPRAKEGAHVLPQGPIYRDVAADGIDQFARDVTQRIVSQHLHRAVVCSQRVVKG